MRSHEALRPPIHKATGFYCVCICLTAFVSAPVSNALMGWLTVSAGDDYTWDSFANRTAITFAALWQVTPIVAVLAALPAHLAYRIIRRLTSGWSDAQSRTLAIVALVAAVGGAQFVVLQTLHALWPFGAETFPWAYMVSVPIGLCIGLAIAPWWSRVDASL